MPALTAADLRWDLDPMPVDDAEAWRLIAVEALHALADLQLRNGLLEAAHVMTRRRTAEQRRRDPLDTAR